MNLGFVEDIVIRKRQKTSENGWQRQKRLAVRLAETLLSQEGWRNSNPWVALSATEAPSAPARL